MLNNLFGDFFGGNGDNKITLKTGGNPGQLNGADRERIAHNSQLSDTPTTQSVFTLANNTGILEAQPVLLQQESNLKLQQQKDALASLQIRVTHAEQSMKNAKQYKEIISKHGKNILTHEIESQVIEQSLSGYQSAMQAAESKILL